MIKSQLKYVRGVSEWLQSIAESCIPSYHPNTAYPILHLLFGRILIVFNIYTDILAKYNSIY